MSQIVKLLKTCYCAIATRTVTAYNRLSATTRKIIKYALIVLAVYVVAHLVLSRISTYLYAEIYDACNVFQPYTAFNYLPINPELIWQSNALQNLEVSLRVFFFPVLYLDYCLTGMIPCSFPLMGLTY